MDRRYLTKSNKVEGHWKSQRDQRGENSRKVDEKDKEYKIDKAQTTGVCLDPISPLDLY